LPECNCSGAQDLGRQIRRNFCSNLCPTNSSGSAPDYFRSAAHRSKRPLSQYFSSTDSALLWLRHCAECLNSPRRSLPAHRSTGSILLSSYASLFIRKRGLSSQALSESKSQPRSCVLSGKFSENKADRCESRLQGYCGSRVAVSQDRARP